MRRREQEEHTTRTNGGKPKFNGWNAGQLLWSHEATAPEDAYTDYEFMVGTNQPKTGFMFFGIQN